jgi:EF-P beta-lysylation protein EpmB
MTQPLPWQNEWQSDLLDSFTQAEELMSYLGIELSWQPVSREASERFPFRVTRSYAARMEKGNVDDPLLRQVLPLKDELAHQPGYLADPVGDVASIAAPGVLHKYRARALLITTGSCAINCRFCFRREFPYNQSQLSKQMENAGLAYIAKDRTIREVILSGGDPLILRDSRLNILLQKIAAIPHVRRLRIHTRLPVVLPSRITAKLIDCLRRTRLQTIIIIHANHANEVNDEVAAALGELRRAGIALLNQSVLLRSINDRTETLIELSEALFQAGVLPYYLHLLDKVSGAAHFDVSLREAAVLHRAMREQLPGYLVPRLVRERAGAPYKILL